MITSCESPALPGSSGNVRDGREELQYTKQSSKDTRCRKRASGDVVDDLQNWLSRRRIQDWLQIGDAEAECDDHHEAEYTIDKHGANHGSRKR